MKERKVNITRLAETYPLFELGINYNFVNYLKNRKDGIV